MYNANKFCINSAYFTKISLHTFLSLTISTCKLEYCAVTYFAAYLKKKCLDKFKCKESEKTLITRSSLTNCQELLMFVHLVRHLPAQTQMS